MQVSADKVKDFQPVEIKIVFETEEELEVFYTLTGREYTVAECVYPHAIEKSKKLTSILSKIYQVMRGVK